MEDAADQSKRPKPYCEQKSAPRLKNTAMQTDHVIIRVFLFFLLLLSLSGSGVTSGWSSSGSSSSECFRVREIFLGLKEGLEMLKSQD
jgi:hypothetical protein